MFILKPLPKKVEAYSNVISEKVVNWHHDKHHAGYVAKLNEIIEKLSTANKSDSNANYSEFGELKRRQSFNHAGIVLHDNYWKIFGSDGTFSEDLVIIKKIKEDFGSIENWKQDFIATGKSALGWVITIWDSYTDKIINVSVDYHNNGAFWDSILLIACDVFEHAYYSDYGPDRAKYLESFVNSLDWKTIDSMMTGENGEAGGCGCGGGSCGTEGGCCSGEDSCCGDEKGECEGCKEGKCDHSNGSCEHCAKKKTEVK